MNDPEEALGRTLSALLREETDAMQIDTRSAAERLARQLNQTRPRRHATAGLAAAAAVLVAVVAGLFWAIQNGDQTSPGPVDVPPPPKVGEPYYLDLATGSRTALPADLAKVLDQSRLSYSPDGAKVAYICSAQNEACPADAGKGNLIVVANADGSDPVAHPLPSGGTAFSPVWTPDGSSLVYQQTTAADNVGNIVVMDAATGQPTQVTDLDLTGSYWSDNLRLDVSPGGQTIAFHRPRTAGQNTAWDVWSVPITGGKPSRVMRDAVYPKYLADGTILSVAPGQTAFDGRRITIRNPDGSRRVLVRAPHDIFNLEVSPDRSRVIPYSDGGRPQIIDTGTGKATRLAIDGDPLWVDDETLVVSPPSG